MFSCEQPSMRGGRGDGALNVDGRMGSRERAPPPLPKTRHFQNTLSSSAAPPSPPYPRDPPPPPTTTTPTAHPPQQPPGQRPPPPPHLRRRVHEVELEQVVDVQRLEQQHDVGEVGALDLGHARVQHLLAERRLCAGTQHTAEGVEVNGRGRENQMCLCCNNGLKADSSGWCQRRTREEAPAGAGAGTPRTPRPLVGRRLGLGEDLRCTQAVSAVQAVWDGQHETSRCKPVQPGQANSRHPCNRSHLPTSPPTVPSALIQATTLDAPSHPHQPT